MIPEGYFRARGVKGGFQQSPQKGTPCVVVTLRLEEGQSKGELIDWIGWLGEKTKARTAESLAHMGFDGEDWNTVTKKEVIAVIRHEEITTQKGEKKSVARVAFINDPSRSTARFQEMKATDAMSESLKALVLDAKQRTSQSSESFEFGANAPGEDNIKF